MSNNSLSRSTEASTAPATGSAVQAPGGAARPALVPPVDIVENDAAITLYADMPGVSRERLGVRVDGDSLVIEGSAEVQIPERLEILHSEIRNPHFRRIFTLSRELDAAKISATLKDGVLRLVIPKAEEAKPRRIDVTVA